MHLVFKKLKLYLTMKTKTNGLVLIYSEILIKLIILLIYKWTNL